MSNEPSFIEYLLNFLQALTAFLLIWFWTAFHQIKDKLTELTKETKEWQAKIDVVVFGATGNNGLHGTSKDHETRLRLLEQSIER